MQKRHLYILIFLTYILSSCKLEIPEDKAGVLISEITDEVNPEVLTTGLHRVNPLSILVLYDIREKQKTFKFDILTKDVHSGNITFSIIYTPIVKNLPLVHKEYGLSLISDDYSLDLLIEQEIRSQIRNFILDNYNKGDIDSTLFDTVKSTILSKESIIELVNISYFNFKELTFSEE